MTEQHQPLTDAELGAIEADARGGGGALFTSQAIALVDEVKRLKHELSLALTPDAKMLLASRDKRIAELRNDNARLVRAAGRAAASEQLAREECDAMAAVVASLEAEAAAHKADVLRLEDLVEARRTSAASDCAVPSPADSIDECMEHMHAGGVIENASDFRGRQRRIHNGRHEYRNAPTYDWRETLNGHLSDMEPSQRYLLLPIEAPK